MNHKFKIKQRVAALCMAAMMCCSMFPVGAFAEAPQADADGTPIVVQDNENVAPDAPQTDESDPDPGKNTPKGNKTPIVTQSADEDAPVETSTDYTFDGAVLYTDLPDAPTGSYMGSQGLPVATGETKIGISAWPNDQLEESTDSYLSEDTLNSDDLTMMAPLLEGTGYTVAPILAQVEYPADGSSLDVVLPNEVTVLDFYGVPADEAARSSLVHSEYTETSAAVMGLYVQADADFSAQLVYTAPDGSTLTKVLHIVIDRSRTMAAPFAETTDVAAYAERPTPAVTSGKITKVEKVNGTWLIWFNGEEAYCCTHGANGQPKGCPPYTYTNTSGNIVVIEKCMKLTTEINHSARLVDVDEYGVSGADMLYGFVAGVLAGNYDITELFLDGILRITDHDMAAAAKVLNAIDKITSNIEVVVTVSADAADLPENLKKFVI